MYLTSAAFVWPAFAQQADTSSLPSVQVSPPKKKKPGRLPRNTRQTDAKPKVQQPPQQVAAPVPGSLASANPEASRVAEIGGLPGSFSTVITAKDIAQSPGQTVQDVLGQQAGIQLQTLYGGVNGAGTTVDLRGFGAFASANTLILLNGRRLNDTDLQGVDLSTIPLQSIERIEITRGNSGAVLYGDNAVGGVINIITKTGAGGPPATARIEGGIGSFNQRFGNASATTNYGPWSTTTFINAIHSDGYRANNALDQQTGNGEIRYTTPDLKAFFNVTGDNQHLGLPGGRSTKYFLNNVNQLATDPRGTSSPLDYGDKQGGSITTGFTKTLWNGIDFILDGGVRKKKQQAGFFGDPADPFAVFSQNYVNSTLTTWSITPRFAIKSAMFGLPTSIVTGFDYYDYQYDSDRSQLNGTAPVHVYNIAQQSTAAYWQQTVNVLPTTDLTFGGRIQSNQIDAHDTFNGTAPGAFGSGIAPLNDSETHHALNIGVDHKLSQNVTLFARAAQAFRTPNVDERIGAGPNPGGVNTFDLKTQTSYDFESGVRINTSMFDFITSYYDMHLKNELHFDPVNFVDTNLDPTHRYGTETNVTYRLNEALRLKGSFAFTRAVFEEGPFAGNDVPLVSRFSGSAGVSWNVWQNYLVFDATVRAWSKRRMDNDQRNFQPEIPANATVDLKLSGEYDRYFWSVSLNNAFNALYYDYAVASPSTFGTFNAYPLPGRTYLLKIGANF